MSNNEEKEIISSDEVIINPESLVVSGTVSETENPDSASRGNRGHRKNERKPSKRQDAPKQEFDSKIINVRRVTRVVSGGRRFSFSIAMVIGDRKGKVGVGTGKSGDTPIAMDKAMRDAKKNMIKLNLNDKNSISHPVKAKYSSAIVSIMPAPGKGVIAGSSTRVILELAGVKEVSSKILSRSKNKLNIAKATLKALMMLKNNSVKVK